ncbi:Imm17 family immunity protein [Flavobacterium panacagri]|uniref:Imm17 family immunity protein n=1 Tax=Flavobacterium panacagri TaxID=3034146 RepID=UPI0025A51DC9|nr:Imm17 family immunity protein [Flavobacterium panacagri]
MNIEDYFEKIRNNPNLAYPILLGVAIFVLIGIILDWDWLLDPQGNNKLNGKWNFGDEKQSEYL